MWHIPEPRNMELWYSHIKLQTREQQKQDNHRSHYRSDISDTKNGYLVHSIISPNCKCQNSIIDVVTGLHTYQTADESHGNFPFLKHTDQFWDPSSPFNGHHVFI